MFPILISDVITEKLFVNCDCFLLILIANEKILCFFKFPPADIATLLQLVAFFVTFDRCTSLIPTKFLKNC